MGPDWKALARRTELYRRWRTHRDTVDLRRWTDRDETALAFYAPFVRAGGLCFDVGANVGNRLKVFHRLGARVVAVEPQPRCARVLRAVYGGDPRVALVESALGAGAGSAQLHVGVAHTIATLSTEWMERVGQTGRFGRDSWDRTLTVPVTTLDALIDRHGMPDYVKIDVEGFEESVLAGLSRPVPTISFEFTPEHLDATFRCLDRVESLGCYEGAYTMGESFAFDPVGWTDLGRLRARLDERRRDYDSFGDVFVRRLVEA